MALAGPRLDRPSAIGDEGRPRATSLAVASLTVLALFVAAGWALGSPGFVLGVATLVGLVAAGMGLQNRSRTIDLFVGNLCLLGAGSLLMLTVISLALGTRGPLVAGFTMAMLALALTWANVADAVGFERAIAAAGRSFVAFLCWSIGAAITFFAGVLVWALVTDPVIGREPLVALPTFGLAVAGAGVAVHVALDTLPIVQLRPRSRRSLTVRRIEAARWFSEGVAKGGIAIMLGVIVLGAVTSMATRAPGPPLRTVPAGVVASPFVLGVPVTIAVLASLAAGLCMAVRTVARHVENAATNVLPPAAAGLAFTLLLPVVAGGLPRVLVVNPGSVLLLLVFGPIALIVAFALIFAGMSVGIVPDRAGGPAMAAGSLLLATIGAGLLSLPTPLVLAIAAGALVVWDVSTFGLGVTAELGHRPETRRLELFHSVLAVGVGLATVLTLSAIDFLRRGVAIEQSVRLAAGLAVAAVLVAVAVLRR